MDERKKPHPTHGTSRSFKMRLLIFEGREVPCLKDGNVFYTRAPANFQPGDRFLYAGSERVIREVHVEEGVVKLIV